VGDHILPDDEWLLFLETEELYRIALKVISHSLCKISLI